MTFKMNVGGGPNKQIPSWLHNFISKNYLSLAIVAILFVLAYFPVLKNLVLAWYNSEDYSHGFFILPISIYLIWHSKHKLAKMEVRGAVSGLILFIFSLLIYLVAHFAEIRTLESFSMILSLAGFVWYIFGIDYLREVSFPLFLLTFMIPIPAQVYSSLTIPLQLFVSTISAGAASLIGVPMFREGNVIHLSQRSLEVVQACSGLRSLMAILTVSTIYGYLTLKSKFLRIGLMITTIPTAILVNTLRVTAIIIALHFFNYDLMSGPFHTMVGVIIFLFAMTLMIAAKRALSIWDTSQKTN